MARLLAPEVFGQVVILTVFANLAMTFIEGGLNTALVQSREVDERDYSTVFLITLALSAVFAFAFCSSVTIQESSMDPTFQAGNKVLINRTSYVIGRVKRGDLIAYSNSERTDASVHVKRVVGLPGETIQIRDGLILINGQTYIEDRDVAAITFGGLAEAGITLGADEYFVLGDNRNNSEDSRYTDVGNIKKSDILGKVWLIISPRSSFGRPS